MASVGIGYVIVRVGFGDGIVAQNSRLRQFVHRAQRVGPGVARSVHFARAGIAGRARRQPGPRSGGATVGADGRAVARQPQRGAGQMGDAGKASVRLHLARDMARSFARRQFIQPYAAGHFPSVCHRLPPSPWISVAARRCGPVFALRLLLFVCCSSNHSANGFDTRFICRVPFRGMTRGGAGCLGEEQGGIAGPTAGGSGGGTRGNYL